MKLTCKRCNHRWKTKGDTAPAICPRCKSKKYDTIKSEKEVTEDLNELCDSIIRSAEHLDYCTMSPKLLLTVMVAFSKAEKAFTNDSSAKGLGVALNNLEVIERLVISKILPEEIYMVCNRVAESYFRDFMAQEENDLTPDA